MKKITILFASSLLLISCSFIESSESINCRNIVVTKDGAQIFNNTHSESYSRVYEYKSESGRCIYLNEHLTYYQNDNQTGSYITLDKSIYFYIFPTSDRYTEYFYSRFVGFLKYEENYYYLPNEMTIDSEKKWSKYKSEDNPPLLPGDGEPNNEEAYQCSKNGYYINNGLGGSQTYATIHVYEIDGSLERHSYTKLDKDCVVTYIPIEC